jgi:hypothetical protein
LEIVLSAPSHRLAPLSILLMDGESSVPSSRLPGARQMDLTGWVRCGP